MSPLPQQLVISFAYALPWIETVIGFLVFIGLLTRQALSAGAVLILVLTFGTTLRQDWETAGQQLIYATIFAGLLAFSDANSHSLDALFRRQRR